MVTVQSWRRDFPDLPHEPQNLDLVRRHLSWTPAERLENLRRVHAFLVRARAGRWLAPLGQSPADGQR